MHPKIKVAYQYLKSQCKDNGVEVYYKLPSIGKKNAILIGSDKGHLGSIGIIHDGSLKCLIKDHASFKWAKDEGFSYEDMKSHLYDKIFPEVSIVNLCRIFNGVEVETRTPHE